MPVRPQKRQEVRVVDHSRDRSPPPAADDPPCEPGVTVRTVQGEPYPDPQQSKARANSLPEARRQEVSNPRRRANAGGSSEQGAGTAGSSGRPVPPRRVRSGERDPSWLSALRTEYGQHESDVPEIIKKIRKRKPEAHSRTPPPRKRARHAASDSLLGKRRMTRQTETEWLPWVEIPAIAPPPKRRPRVAGVRGRGDTLGEPKGDG